MPSAKSNVPGACSVELLVSDDISLIKIDDGKVNALSIEVMTELLHALDGAEQYHFPVVLTGREGIFSAGFDLNEIWRDPETALHVLKMGAMLCKRLMEFPYPVLCACTGHAYPMGAFLLLSSEFRIGAQGDFNIGMNEVAIGIAVPDFGIDLASARLLPAAFNKAVLTGELIDPDEAANVGFLDQVVLASDLRTVTTNKAHELAKLDSDAFRKTKSLVRNDMIASMNRFVETTLTPSYTKSLFSKRMD